MSEEYHFWDSSQIEDVEQILILITSWVTEKRHGITGLATNYHIDPYDVMRITDQSLDILEETCSTQNLPSPIKKAACLCYYTATNRPLRHSEPDGGYSELEERIVNAKMGIDFAFIYLRFSSFSGSNVAIDVQNTPQFPSKHFMVDFVQRLASGDLQLGGLCMLLELLLYAANPEIARIIDSNMDERLNMMVEGYSLADLYHGLSSM